MKAANGYECEHGNACEPGGLTGCPECPRDDPDRVRYRPDAAYRQKIDAALASLRATEWCSDLLPRDKT